jgi:hypothetical protein
VVFIILLQVMAERYEFVYRKPLLISLAGVVVVVVGGGFLVASTPLHHQIALFERSHPLPPYIDDWYRHPARPARVPDVQVGKVIGLSSSTLTIVDTDGDPDDGTSTVIITPQTRFPDGAAIAPDDEVMIIGDQLATGTLRAFGIRIVGHED